MHLSTFSSKNILGRLLLATFVLVTSYIICIQVKKPTISYYTNTGLKNLAYAQDFVFENADSKIVILGSSMAARLKIENNNVYNLSFNGGSVLTGLSIITKSKAKPKFILIEINTIDREIDKNLISKVFEDKFYFLKKHIVAFQDKYQPLNLLGGYIVDLLGANEKDKFSKNINEKVLQTRIDFKMKLYSQKIDYRLLDERLLTLKDLLKKIDPETKVFFFEMPNSKVISNSPRLKSIREKIMNDSDLKTYTWLEKPDSDAYETTDGTHLSYKGAKKYSIVLMKEIKKLKIL